MNRQRNKFHCDLPHPTKSELDKLRVNCKPVESSADERAKQIGQDMLLAFVKIVDTHNRLLIHSAKQPSPPASCNEADSHASEEVEKQDLD
tara:strand:+ start:117 stop:389 length:273 start_codon:yes stop_codon:yes gene_type:complete